MNYAMDPRLLSLSEYYRKAGLDRECLKSPDHATVTCVGSLKVAIGFKRSFYTSIGFRCGFERPIDINYTISVIPIADDEVPCTNWADALSNLQQPIYPPLQTWVDNCAKAYEQFSSWNMLGLAQYDYLNMFLLSGQVLDSKCYQHMYEFACRSFFPECTENSTIVLECKESCQDFNAGCYHEFTTAQSVGGDAKFNVSCTSLSNRTDPEGKPCYYEPVVCSAKPDISSHEKITHQNGSTATSVAALACGRLFRSDHNTTELCAGTTVNGIVTTSPATSCYLW